MTNAQIADTFSLMAKLIDIHGVDPFKSKSYSIAAFTIDNITEPLSEMDAKKMSAIKGIGVSTSKKIMELLSEGRFTQLEEIISITPPGVIEMLKIKGIGPKKINIIWKEMGIETVGELLYACKENRLKNYKGFGEKTQQTVIDNIEFYFRNKGNFLYAQLITIAAETEDLLKKIFKNSRVFITGDFARQMELITHLEFVCEENITGIEKKLSEVPGFSFKEKKDDHVVFSSDAGVDIKIWSAPKNIIHKLVETSSSPAFFASLSGSLKDEFIATDEADFFTRSGGIHIPAFLREDPSVLARKEGFNDHLSPQHIRGLIHCHSTWSDGNNTIEEMAAGAMEQGMEYMAISDHSQTAAYAGGLTADKILKQHEEIDSLNKKLAPFQIFKSIESDILGDGSLDYPEKVLASFDLVIASVHSNLRMSEEKAMTRLIKAIENPYTTIMGHVSGRLLLSRAGYPLDYKKLIDACAANKVVIELNSNPNRLDMDWCYIGYAMEKGVLISINPDAHSVKGISDVRYGVFAAQKGMLTAEHNLSSFSLEQFSDYIQNRCKEKGL